MPTKAKTTQAAPQAVLHNDPETMRDSIFERIKTQAMYLRDNEAGKRAHWAAIGADLLMARESTLSTAEFGNWIAKSGLAELPGLETAPQRSDAIWLAEHPSRADFIDESISTPRYIRQKWRNLFGSLCETEADALSILDAVDVPDIEAAADAVVEKTGADRGEAYEEIKRRIDLAADDEGSLEVSVAKAIPKLKKALQAAADAGVTHDMLCAAAGGVWGGFFAWSHQPAPSNAQEAMGAAAATAKDEALSFKDFISMAGEVFSA